MSKKRDEAERTLPPELRGTYNELIADYKEAASDRTGQPWVNYAILAKLIKLGWRKSAASVEISN